MRELTKQTAQSTRSTQHMVPPVSRAPASSVMDDSLLTEAYVASRTQMINRVRGKTKEQRMRDRKRVKKANKAATGHVPKTHRVAAETPLTRRKGAVKLGAMTKKSIRKREKRAKNVSRASAPR